MMLKWDPSVLLKRNVAPLQLCHFGSMMRQLVCCHNHNWTIFLCSLKFGNMIKAEEKDHLAGQLTSITITCISCASSKTTSRKGTVGDFTGRKTGVSEREHLNDIIIVIKDTIDDNVNGSFAWIFAEEFSAQHLGSVQTSKERRQSSSGWRLHLWP